MLQDMIYMRTTLLLVSVGLTVSMDLTCLVTKNTTTESLVGTKTDLSLNLRQHLRSTSNKGCDNLQTAVKILAVVSVLHWKTMVLIHDAGADALVDHILALMALKGYPSARIVRMSNGTTPTRIKQVLEDLDNKVMVQENYLLLCQSKCLQWFLQEINRFEKHHMQQAYFTYKAQWLLLDLPGNLPCLARFVGNITNVLTMSPEASSASNLDQIIPVCSSTSNNTSPGLYTAYFGVSGRHFQYVGKFDGTSVKVLTSLMPNVKYGLNGRHFIVGTMLWRPFVIRKVLNGSQLYTGMTMDLLSTVAATLNFTYTITIPRDNMWGSFINGSWTGLPRQLESKEADMTAAPLAINLDREKVMDFSQPFYYEFYSVLMKTPDQNGVFWKWYLRPFKWNLWLIYVACGPAVFLIIWGIGSASVGLDGCRYTRKDRWSVVGAIFIQGSIYNQTTVPPNAVLFFWWIFCIIMGATYAGNLIAFLTVTKVTLPFKTLEELVNQNDYKFGLQTGTISDLVIKKSNSPVYQKFWRTVNEFSEQDKDVMSTVQSVHMAKVRQGKYAYLNDMTGFTMEMENDCDLITLKDKFIPSPYALGLQERSAYSNDVSDVITHLSESGILESWKKKWWPKKRSCALVSVAKSKPVKLQHVQGIFYFLGAILSTSVLVFALECLQIPKHFKRCPKKFVSCCEDTGRLNTTFQC